jgi:hypothetical protein
MLLNEAGEMGDGGGAPSETPASTTPETPAPEVTETPAAGTPMEKVEYTPNFKYNSMDQEYEFDKTLHPLIKDEATEKIIRDLYLKAAGLDINKKRSETYQKQYEEINGKWTEATSEFKKLGTYLTNKDFGSFFGAFGLTDDDVFKYALDRLEYFNLPQDKRQAMDAQAARNQQFAELSLENEKFKQAQEQQQLTQMADSLNAAVSAPHVVNISQKFDAQAGQPGAFRNAVIAHAQAQSHIAGRDLSVNEAVESFIKTFGLTSMAGQPQAAAPGTATPQGEQRPQSLPKVSSSSATPVKKQVKSMADLRKLQEQAFSNGHG